MPYIYSAAVEAARTGAPMMRALCVDYPDDPVAWQADLQYLLGRDLLVAPMTAPEGVRQVYLPAGRWVDYWTGEVLDGSRYVRVAKPLDQIPLFVRYGALIPVQEEGDTVDVPEQITLVAFGGGDATVHIHDADGLTVAVATRDGDELRVAVTGPKRVTGVDIVPVTGAPVRAVLS
ncbi:hypothetical protein [Nonomuraea sp. N2-4H]